MALLVAAAGCAAPTTLNKGSGTGGSTGGQPSKGTGGHATTGAGGSTTGTGGSTTGTGGSTGTSTTGTGGSTGTSTTGTGGSTSGTDGTGGSTGGGIGGADAGTVVQKLCATTTTIMNPVFMDFENYTGSVTAANYATAFGGATPNTGTAYAGVYGYGDGSATPVLSILAGHPPSNWAVSQTVSQTSSWGMGGGVWMGCANASAYKGISFWVRGSSGTGVFSFNVSMDSTQLPDATNAAGGGTCPGTSDTCKDPSMNNIALTSDWAPVQILWSQFTPGMSGTTSVVPDGHNIVGLVWNVPLAYHADPSTPPDAAATYIAIPGDLTLNIDDITFIQ